MNITLHIDGKPVTLENVVQSAQDISFTLAGKTYHFHGERLAQGGFVLAKEIKEGVWQRRRGAVSQVKGARRVQVGVLEASIAEQAKTAAHAPEMALSPRAPMPGVIRKILVKVDEKVKRDQPLVVMEAMKLQTTLSAGGDGKVEAIVVKEGELVVEGAELVRLK